MALLGAVICGQLLIALCTHPNCCLIPPPLSISPCNFLPGRRHSLAAVPNTLITPGDLSQTVISHTPSVCFPVCGQSWFITDGLYIYTDNRAVHKSQESSNSSKENVVVILLLSLSTLF